MTYFNNNPQSGGNTSGRAQMGVPQVSKPQGVQGVRHSRPLFGMGTLGALKEDTFEHAIEDVPPSAIGSGDSATFRAQAPEHGGKSRSSGAADDTEKNPFNGAKSDYEKLHDNIKRIVNRIPQPPAAEQSMPA